MTLRLLILETGSRNIDAQDELEQCDLVAAEMMRYRQVGYNLVQEISQDSTDPESRDQARRALLQYSFAEGMLVRIATHVDDGLEQVDAAHTATRQAMSLLARWRG